MAEIEDCGAHRRAATKRAHWASTVLAASAQELRQYDSEAAAAFAAESERVAALLERQSPTITRRQAWSA